MAAGLCILSLTVNGAGILPKEEIQETEAQTTETSVTEAGGKLETTLYAKAAVLMDAETGRVLYGKNQGEILPMASTTKIMTCIMALEEGNLEDVVSVSAYAASQPKVRLGMKKGGKYRLEDLLYSLMLESHNDSAVAIAEHIGAKKKKLPDIKERTEADSKKAVAAFLTEMNQKAKELGCEKTCFLTPNGLDAQGKDGRGNEKIHATTAEELARMMAYCIRESPKKEKFLEITGTSSYSFADDSGRGYSCTNHNAFLTMMDGALSGKTGFTSKAGYCYVGALEREGKCFTVALLACGWPNHKSWKWADSRALMEYGLHNFEYRKFERSKMETEWLLPVEVTEGQTERLGDTAYAKVALNFPEAEQIEGMLLGKEEEVIVLGTAEKTLAAPVKKGMQTGNIRYVVDGKVYREERILVQENVDRITYGWCLFQIWERFCPG